MNQYILRRKYRICMLIFIAGTIFICFQLSSFQFINMANRKTQHHSRSKHGPLVLENVDDDFVESLDKFDKIPAKQELHVERRDTGEFVVKMKETGDNVNQQGGEEKEEIEGDLPLGVHVFQMEAYKKSANGMFKCLQSGFEIPYSSINDDYCDCPDHTDEPGTSACPESQFYCTFQYSDAEPQSIPGSRVNDGVCDCCDGSDEWQGVSVSGAVQISAKRWTHSLQHTPCENKCKSIEKDRLLDEKIRMMGKKLKLSYLETAKGIADKQMYGPDGVFYQLSLSCFDFDTKEYKYTFCPFKSVQQQKFPDASKNLGKVPTWNAKSKGVYVLKMDKGDAYGCPGGWGRKTVITFICGLTDKILDVAEYERCSYSMKFATPAACAIYQLEKLFYGKPVDCGRLLCTLHPTEIRSQKVLNQQSYDIWRTQRLTKIDCPRGEHYEKNRKCIIPEIWKKETMLLLNYFVYQWRLEKHMRLKGTKKELKMEILRFLLQL